MSADSRPAPGAEPRRPAGPLGRALLVLFGLLIGAWSSLCGIGGGVFAVPLLHFGYGLSLQRAVASSLLLVAGSTTSATISELSRSDSSLHFGVVAALVVSSFVGARIGFDLAKRLDARVLKALFFALLVFIATDLLFARSSPLANDTKTAGALVLSFGDYGRVLAIGLAAGIVAPILGVGGGLVAVPGLLFSLPALGYLATRAASTAMSLFTGWQSVWLYGRERKIELHLALWLALGAVVGGWIAVWLVHLPGAMEIARVMLAATLYFVAGRFAWDVARAWFGARRRA